MFFLKHKHIIVNISNAIINIPLIEMNNIAVGFVLLAHYTVIRSYYGLDYKLEHVSAC